MGFSNINFLLLSSFHTLFFKANCNSLQRLQLKFKFSKTATKIENIFAVFLKLCNKCQIDGEDWVAKILWPL